MGAASALALAALAGCIALVRALPGTATALAPALASALALAVGGAVAVLLFH